MILYTKISGESLLSHALYQITFPGFRLPFLDSGYLSWIQVTFPGFRLPYPDPITIPCADYPTLIQLPYPVQVTLPCADYPTLIQLPYPDPHYLALIHITLH